MLAFELRPGQCQQRVLVKSFPSRKADITRQIDVILKATKKEDRASTADDIASTLVDGGVLIDKARALSERAVRASTRS